MAQTKAMIVSIFVALVALVFVACDADRHNEVAEAPQTLVNPWGEPEDSTHVTLRDSTGRILVTGYELGKYAEVQVERTLYADAKEAWKPAEKLAKTVAESAETAFRYNHGDNTVVTKVVLVVKKDYYRDLGDGRVIRLKKGDIIPLYKPENLNLRGGEPATEETPGRLYYAETAVKYSLRYGEIVIAEGIQPFVAAEGFVPEFEENVMLDDEHVSVRAGQVKNNILPIYCTNRQLFAQKWNDMTLRDSTWVNFDCFNPFVLDLHEVKTDDFTKMQKVYNLDANGETTINGVKQRVVREADASVVGSVKYNNVDYTGSVHKCWYDAKTLTLVTTDSADITFVHREGLDKVTKRVGFKTTVVTLKEVLRRFWHTAFPKVATVSGKNISIFHKDKGEFQLLFSDNTKSGKDTIDYGVTHSYEYSLPSKVSRDLKGKTVAFTKNGDVCTAEALVVTFKSRTVGNIMYNGANYKNEAAKCDLVLKSATFGESTVVITATHDKETVTAEVPVTYEAEVTVLKTEPSFTHVKYVTNPVPQGNNVTIVSYDKVTVTDYLSNNTTKVIGSTDYSVDHNYTVSYTSNIQVENLQSFCGRYNLVNGAVTVQGYNFSTTLVSTVYGDAIVNGKNYKSQAPQCPLTPIAVTISENSLVYEYQGSHEGHNDIIKVTFPLSVTEKEVEKLPGKIVAGWATDSYESSTNFHYNWHSSTFQIVMLKDGAYTVYSRDVNATNGWRTTSITSTLATNGMPLAYVGDNGEAEIGYIEKNVSQGSWCKIVYRKADGSLDKALSETEKAFHKDDDMFQRNPVRGTWANGKISADGHTLYVTGTED